MRPRTLALALVLLVGCSWISVRGPGQPKPGQRPDCTTSRAAPNLDTGLALAGAAVFVYLLARDAACDPADHQEDGCVDVEAPFLIIGLPTAVLSALYAFSARSGYRDVHRCREALAVVSP